MFTSSRWVAATIMSAPMLGINLSPTLDFGARAMVKLSRLFRFQSAYAPAPGKATPYVQFQAFEDNVLTNDREHYGWMGKHLTSVPDFGLAAPTLSWMGAAFEEMKRVAARPAPEGPMLMFLGDDETVVEPAAIRAHAAKNTACRLVELPGARHEALMETPAIRETVWAEIDGFLEAQGI